jgi:spore coat protein U-like protein
VSTRTFTAVTLVTIVLLGAVAARPAAQGSATAQLQVTTTVVKRCTITTSNVNFGNYDPVTANATAPLDGAGSVTVTCTQGSVATIGIDLGSNVSGSQRRMAGGAAFLNYQLYQDAGRATVWGTTGAAMLTLAAAPSIAPRTYTVYGRVPQAQDVPSGAFLDQAVATVNF